MKTLGACRFLGLVHAVVGLNLLLLRPECLKVLQLVSSVRLRALHHLSLIPLNSEVCIHELQTLVFLVALLHAQLLLLAPLLLLPSSLRAVGVHRVARRLDVVRRWRHETDSFRKLAACAIVRV